MVVSQNIVAGKTDSDEEFCFAETLPMLVNRFGYTTQQTQDVLSSLLTVGKVRIHYKENWQRLSLKNPSDKMKPMDAEQLVNETLSLSTPGLMRITIPQAVSTEFTMCI